MCRLVTSIKIRIAFSGTLVFFYEIDEVHRVFIIKIRLLFFCYRLKRVSLQMQTASQSDHHIQISWVSQLELVCEYL